MATEKRLIEMIAERLKDAYPQADRNNLCPAIYYDDFAEIVDDVLSEIGESVDAVEVVRCKDCKNFLESFSGTHSCKLHKGLVGTKYDTFCSYGERKDND